MSDLDHIVTAYAHMERQVQHLMNALCRPYCSICPKCCCRPDICDESIDSAFLQLLRTLDPPEQPFCDQYGWLTVDGCALPIGRPPVCYEFICDDIMLSLPDDTARYAMRALGLIMSFLGEELSPLGPLTELADADALRAIRADAFTARLSTANTALNAIQTYLESGTLSPAALAPLLTADTPLLQGP